MTSLSAPRFIRSSPLVALLVGRLVLSPGIARTSPPSAAPSPWVLLGSSSEIAVYLDSTRVERHRPDSLAGVWRCLSLFEPVTGRFARVEIMD
jgi:hypothetical protein